MNILELTDRELYVLTCLCESGFTDDDENEQFVDDSWNIVELVDKAWDECPSGKLAELEPVSYPEFFIK